MIDAAVLGEIELEPIDPSSLRAAEGSTVWETVRGKRNRITIGRPQWLRRAPAFAHARTRPRLPVPQCGSNHDPPV